MGLSALILLGILCLYTDAPSGGPETAVLVGFPGENTSRVLNGFLGWRFWKRSGVESLSSFFEFTIRGIWEFWKICQYLRICGIMKARSELF